jgi:hypothetical protein
VLFRSVYGLVCVLTQFVPQKKVSMPLVGWTGKITKEA